MKQNRSNNVGPVTIAFSSYSPSLNPILIKNSDEQSSLNSQISSTVSTPRQTRKGSKTRLVNQKSTARSGSLTNLPAPIAQFHPFYLAKRPLNSILPSAVPTIQQYPSPSRATDYEERNDEWLDRIDNTDNDLIDSKKKCSFWYVILSIIGIILLIGGVVAAILIPLLTSATTTTTTITKPTTAIITSSSETTITTVTTAPVLLRWNQTGLTVAGITSSPGAASNQLHLPWDLAVDNATTLYVTDRDNNRVQMFVNGSLNGITIAGRANGMAGKSSTTFNQTSGISLDAVGNFYVGDMFNHRVQFFLKNQSSGVTIAGNGIAGNSINQLNMPHCVEYHSTSSTLYITDTYNHRIMRYLLNNSTRTVVAGGNGKGIISTKLSSPHATFYDSSSNSLLIANNGGNNIVRWVLGASSWTLVAGSQNGTAGATSTLLNGPTDVMLDPMGNMYVADRGNHRIQFFLKGQSNATTIAGITGVSGNSFTMLRYPNSVALDNQLNLYVADHYNHRIQKFPRY